MGIIQLLWLLIICGASSVVLLGTLVMLVGVIGYIGLARKE